MKPCYYCKGRKTKLLEINGRMAVKCEKCGAEIVTPYITVDSARGYWNTKMAALERAARNDNKVAAR